MKLSPKFKLAILLVGTSLLQACAVSMGEVDSRVETAEASAKANSEKFATQRTIEPSLVRVRGNFVGGAPVELGYKNRLPSAFRDVTVRSPGATGIGIFAQRLTEATRIPVDVSPDVFGGSSQGGAASSGATSPATAVIEMDFRGNLADYLDIVCARFGLGWSFVNGTINISRYVTKSFQFAASPGASSYGSKVSKGSTAATGATGGAASTANGSFAGTSESAVTVQNLSPLGSLLLTIQGILTSAGKVSVNEATGSIVVTDTRMVVEKVGKLIDSENSMLMRQMALQVEMITLQVNDATQLSVDASMVYRALNGEFGAAVTRSSSLGTTEAGGITYSVLSGATNGSAASVKALNGIGRVVQNTTTTLITTNRVPVPLAQFATKGYLAATAPAQGGGTTAGTGVPGLTPGSVTTGLFLTALPTILDNNSILVRLSVDSSNLLSIDSTSTGSGATFQQIQYPNVTGYKSDHNVTMRSGESLVLVGLDSDQINGAKQAGVLSGSLNQKRAQTIQILVVTPRIQSGA